MKLKTIEPTRSATLEARPSGGASPAQPAEANEVKTATRACPTRASGSQPLFQHSITVSQCQSKQRGMYHKCFTCAHGNGRG